MNVAIVTLVALVANESEVAHLILPYSEEGLKSHLLHLIF